MQVDIQFFVTIFKFWKAEISVYGSGHETVAVLLPGFAINWYQNQETRQPQFRDLTNIQYQYKHEGAKVYHTVGFGL